MKIGLGFSSAFIVRTRPEVAHWEERALDWPSPTGLWTNTRVLSRCRALPAKARCFSWNYPFRRRIYRRLFKVREPQGSRAQFARKKHHRGLVETPNSAASTVTIAIMRVSVSVVAVAIESLRC